MTNLYVDLSRTMTYIVFLLIICIAFTFHSLYSLDPIKFAPSPSLLPLLTYFLLHFLLHPQYPITLPSHISPFCHLIYPISISHNCPFTPTDFTCSLYPHTLASSPITSFTSSLYPTTLSPQDRTRWEIFLSFFSCHTSEKLVFIFQKNYVYLQI